MANQRIAFLSGLVLAAELGRVAVLPRFLFNGTQPTTDEVNELNAKTMPFRRAQLQQGQ